MAAYGTETQQDVEVSREEKMDYIGSDWMLVSYKTTDDKTEPFTVHTGYKIIDHTIDKYGQFLLTAHIEVNTCWTNLGLGNREIIGLHNIYRECTKHKVNRRMLSTVIGNMIIMASYVTTHGRRLFIRILKK